MCHKPGKQSNPAAETGSPPFILMLMLRCTQIGISYDLMCLLNYWDLLALVIENDIVTERSKKQNHAPQPDGPEVVIASNDDILRIHNLRK